MVLQTRKAAACAGAAGAPFRYWKQVASHFGGTQNGLVMSWPKVIKDAGGLRSQFHFISDLAPTLLEAAGVSMPETVDGVPQMSMDGVSMTYTFDAPKAPSRRKVQVLETMENFGIYADGWVAGVTPIRPPWGVLTQAAARAPPSERTWALYNVERDFSQNTDLSKTHPERLRALKAMFWEKAERNHILPIEGLKLPAQAPASRREFEYRAEITGVPASAAPPTFGRSFAILADLGVEAMKVVHPGSG